jgi:hemoglobin
MENSLYTRLGGAEKIKIMVDDIVEAHLENAVIGARFRPYLERPEYVDQVKQHTCDLLGMGSGGPEKYTGRDMETTHKGMNISDEEFVAALDDILMVLEKHGIGDQEKNEVLAMLYGMKDEVVHQ